MRTASVRTRKSLFTGIAILLAACSGGDATPTQQQPTEPPDPRLIVAVSPQLDTLSVDGTRVLSVRVTNVAGVPQQASVDWSSSNPDIATVSQGTVTGVAPGLARIVAKVGIWKDSATIIILPRPVALQLSPAAVNVVQGDTISFEAEFLTSDGVTFRARPTAWQTTDADGARIVGDGMIEALGEGTYTVTAASNGMTATATMSVFAAQVGSVSIDPSSNTMYVGANKTLDAVVRDQNGRVLQNAAVSWRSANTSVATISSTGKVSGLATGGTTITATSGGRSASATVNVVTVPATSASLTLTPDSVLVGHTAQATGTALDAEGRPIPNRPKAYSSSNSLVATVNSSGVVTGRVVGTTQISVLIDGKVASQRLWVVNQLASSISITPSAPSVTVGGKDTLSATVLDQLGQPMPSVPVSWSSSNTGVATINSAGVLTGLAPGSTTITATAAGVSANVTATVNTIQVANVAVSPSSLSIVAGQTGNLTATAYSASGQPLSGRVISWSSANPAVATVSPTGQVTAAAAGTTTLTASTGGKSGAATVTVSAAPPPPVASIVVTLNAGQLNIGQTTQANATAYDANGNVVSGKSFTWASVDPTLVSISTSGLITALAAGSASVSASVDGVTGLASLTVSAPPPVPVASVTLTASVTTLAPGATTPLTVTLFDAQGNVLTGRTVAFSSSNQAVATVGASGVVTGVAPGTAIVSASSGGQSASLTMTVSSTPPPPPVVNTITVTANATNLTVGQTTQATAVAKDSAGNVVPGQSMTWTTSAPSIATVSASGLVTALAGGSVTISASAAGKTGFVTLTVSNPVPGGTVVTVQVVVSNPTVNPGGSGVATATAYDAQGKVVTGNPITWASANSSIATINAGGSYTGVGAGTTSVRADINGVHGLAYVTVNSTTPPPPPGPMTLPALPQVTLNMPYPALTGQSIYVAAGGNLQQAINQANRGDEIVLQAGATFSGNFTLPAKPGTAANGWIVIRSEKLNQMPAIGTRVTSLQAALMPKIITPNVAPAIATNLSASGWRLSGLEISISPSLTLLQYGIVTLGDGTNAQNSNAVVATDLVLDRVWVHGNAGQNTMRCIALNSARTQVSDSYITECHAQGFDSQAIGGWNGPGPFKIVNNTLQGAGENVFFGGADPYISNLITSDVEIKYNYIYTPASWKNVWTKKNLIETKNAQRVLIEGNILDGSWQDGQVGYGVVLKSTNQSGGCPWCRSVDITFRYNRMTNVGGGFNLAGWEASTGNYVSQHLERVLIEHNIVDNVNTGVYTGASRLIQVIDSVANLTIRNNTITSTGTLNSFLMFGNPPTPVYNFSFRDNIVSSGQYGLFGSGVGEGQSALNLVTGTIDWTNVVVISSTRASYPTGTVWVPTLAAGQAIANAGANTAQVNAMTAGVMIP